MKRRKHDEILPLGEDQDYDGLSDAVIRWAKFRYGKMIAEYQSLPWLKKLFRRNPKFCLVRTHDDLFCSSPGIWYMRLKTIEGTYKVYGYDEFLCTWVHDMYPDQKFSHARLVLEWIRFKEKAGILISDPAFFYFVVFFVVLEVGFVFQVLEAVFVVFFFVSQVIPMISRQSSKVRSVASFHPLGIL